MQKKDAAARGPVYAYHDSGLLQSRTWARGVVTTYGWTPAGDPETVSYGDGTPGSSRTYRRDGSLATVTDAAGTTTYAYNGTLASGESTTQGLLDGLTLSYPQSQGRRQSFTATLGGDIVSSMGYGYDDQGRLDEVSEPGIGAGGFTALFGYVPGSDLPFTTTSQAGGTAVLTGTRGYDAADRLTSIGYERPGNTVVTSHAYLLDAADRRTRAEREDGTAWSYGYNDRDEVTSAVKLLPGEELLAGWQQTFDYDNLGNRKWTFEGGDSSGANRRQTVYTPNALNQYTQISHPNAFDVLGRAPSDVGVTVNGQPVSRQGEFWRREVGDLPNALAAVWQPVQVDAVDPGAGPNGADVPARRSGHRFVPMASETPFYDFDGNLVSDARWVYVWNAENQLIEMTTSAPALAASVPRERYRYVYDSRSRRIARTVESWDLDAGAWVLEKNERFIHDDWNVVAVVDAAGEVVQRFAWGSDLSGTRQGAGGVGGLLAAADATSGRAWCYAYDGNGNVSAVVDLADGTKVGRYDYDAFGRTIASWGDEGLAGVNAYRFSTKPLEGTGLYYYGFRWYEPGTGRWLSRDPIGERGGVNLNGFVGNWPVDKIDRLGLDDHHWLMRMGAKPVGQAAVRTCTLGRCLCDIDSYTTHIYGNMPDPVAGYPHWGGSPHSVLHGILRYGSVYKLVLEKTKGRPCQFWVTMDLTMKAYDKMLAGYGSIVGFQRGSHSATGPALHYFKDPSFQTNHSWNIEGVKCCKRGSRNRSIFDQSIEPQLINLYEQALLQGQLQPIRPNNQRPQDIFFNHTNLSPPELSDKEFEILILVIAVGAILLPEPSTTSAGAAAVGTIQASRLKKIIESVEQVFRPGVGNFARLAVP